MASRSYNNDNMAKTSGIELEEIDRDNSGGTPPHNDEYGEDNEKVVHEDYAHMTRLGKKQQFDVCTMFWVYRCFSS